MHTINIYIQANDHIQVDFSPYYLIGSSIKKSLKSLTVYTLFSTFLEVNLSFILLRTSN